MKKCYFFVGVVFVFLFIQMGYSQTTANVGQANAVWIPLMKGDKFDPNDDQQSVADTDFVGNATYAMVETQKQTLSFTDGITDDVYFFRVRMGQSFPSTSFYLGIDVTGDRIADLFVEANNKSQTPYVSFHKRDYSKTGLTPSQTAWLNGTKNNELFLSGRNAHISTYSAQTDIDGGNSGVDFWIEFGFTEESLKAYVLANFGVQITGDSAIALYGFTSTSQTSNGDIAGVNDTEPGVLDKTWEELGVIINGTLNNIASGEILTPTVTAQTTSNTSPTITGTWGGSMLGDDSLIVTVNGISYSQEIYTNNTDWSLTILYPELTPGTYDVTATVTRKSNNATKTDTTSSELTILSAETTTTVSSGNDGGLESNGDLASLIAQRNFNRIKNNNYANKKALQKKYSAKSSTAKLTNATVDFSSLLPSSALLGTETAYVSSPTDLIGITNAQQVYAVDYYQGEKRVAAVLATKTATSIYGHSKAICDRLNDSSLEDIVTINLNGYAVILVKIKRANGFVEYALNFSIQQLETENVLHSYWNIDQYPTGDYINFQVWGASTSQVSFIANAIITKFKALGPLSKRVVENRIPTVFVKKGYYKNGQLHLTIINKARAFHLDFQGNKKATELTASNYIAQNISLSAAYEQEIQLDLGGIFDIGFAIKGDTSKQLDALYLADGPWGIDYVQTETAIASFDIEKKSEISIIESDYAVERNAKVSGKVFGTMNLFRNILPGELVFDAQSYAALGFQIQNSVKVEVILVTENTSDWNNRLRFQLPVNSANTSVVIPFGKFTNPKGESYKNEKIKGIVFSVQGDYKTFQDFEVAISQLSFKKTAVLEMPTSNQIVTTKLYNYPNPCSNETTLVLPEAVQKATVAIVDVLGKTIQTGTYNNNEETNEIAVNLDRVISGIYFFVVTTEGNKQFKTKFLVKQ
ncbi:T9SS type A sorting domain-containing protein [Flavobacterium sp. MAHUQ-51]|uniref:T9SS type A sorting domain-containing protein n=1 Tax=Flavobacterium sp. GCM10022190 TaxID=3252639 RepID=UPI0036190CE7